MTIDLRSDTVTKPTEGMMNAIMEASNCKRNQAIRSFVMPGLTFTIMKPEVQLLTAGCLLNSSTVTVG